MVVSQSAPLSPPGCVAASNATVAQWLASPEFDFTGWLPGELTWFMRRSSTFGAPVVAEYTPDGGLTWVPLPGDTLLPDGSASYTGYSRHIPGALAASKGARFRWRTIPASTGSAGTLRFDDFSITVHAAYDIALLRLEAVPRLVRAGEPVTVTGVVKNVGLVPASGFSLLLSRNCGDTVRPVPCSPLGSSSQSGGLLSGDSCVLSLRADSLEPGANRLVGVLQDASDGSLADNILPLEVDVAAAPGTAVINEIMYEPFPDEGEYLEIRNNGITPLNLSGWQIVARSGGKERVLRLPTLRHALPPGKCAVVAEDSALVRFFPALAGADSGHLIVPPSWETRLNNDGGEILLRDPWGTLCDSVAWSPSWHNPAVADRSGRSLERILSSGHSSEASNWSTCTLPEGGTPARENSVALTRSTRAAVLSALPNPFSPDGDGRDDMTLISYSLPRGVWSVSVRVFDARGRLIRTLATCTPSTGSGECIWDGRDEERLTARMGIYVVHIEAFDTGGLAACSAAGVVVLARRLR